MSSCSNCSFRFIDEPVCGKSGSMNPNYEFKYGVKSMKDILMSLLCLAIMFYLPRKAMFYELFTLVFIIIFEFQINNKDFYNNRIEMRKKRQYFKPPNLDFLHNMLNFSENVNTIPNENFTVSRYQEQPVTHIQPQNPLKTQISIITPGKHINRNPIVQNHIQLTRVQDSLTDLMKKDKQNKKVISKQSISSSLHTSKSYNRQDKLLQQICDLEYKIKQIKYQRELVANKNARYNMLRPFMEMQSKNMMNLQKMMLVNQQNQMIYHQNMIERHQMMMMNPYQFNPYPYPGAPPLPYQYNPNLNKNNAPKQKGTYRSKLLLRKFRVAVIAVYFSLYIVPFIKKFTIKRYQQHASKYYVRQTSFESLISKTFMSQVKCIDFYSVAKRAQKNKNKVFSGLTQRLQQVVIFIKQNLNPDKGQSISISETQFILLELLTQIQALIQQQKFEQTIQLMSQIHMPLSFPVDHMFFIQEIYRLSCHPQKLYFLHNESKARMMIMTTFFIKLLYVNLLAQVREDEDWKDQIMESYSIQKGDKIMPQLAAIQMYFTGLLLVQHVVDLISNISRDKGYIHMLKPEQIPIPFDTIAQVQNVAGSKQGAKNNEETASEKSQSIKSYSQFSSKSKIDQQEQDNVYLTISKNLNVVNDKYIQKISSSPLFGFQFIRNIESTEGILHDVFARSKKSGKVQQKLVKISLMLYDRAKQYKTQYDMQLKMRVMNQNQNLLKKGAKDQIDFVMMPRNPKKIKFFRDLARVFQNKVLEERNIVKQLLIQQDGSNDEERSELSQSEIKAQQKALDAQNLNKKRQLAAKQKSSSSRISSKKSDE